MDKLVEFFDRDAYLLARVLVPWTTETAKKIIDLTKSEATARAYHRIIFDLTFWEKPDSELTRFWSGEYLARQLGYPFKVSAFANPSNINKFAETTALNRGADFRVFGDEKSAVEWLLKES
jgi:hypothetical protein